MKYVKIFDSQMRPLGVLQLGAELAQSEETKYVKVYDENLDKCNGVVALSDNISEADAAKNIKIYDANLILIGGSTVGEIANEGKITTSIELNYDDEPIVNDYLTMDVVIVADSTAYDATGNVEIFIDNESQPQQTTQIEGGVASFELMFTQVGKHPFRVHYEGDEQYLPADVNGTITVTE